ncbi:MAG: TIGR04348 family glycosyltransferase [Betaproteobacteria bacterium]|nr:TIGR04348 family glycosyltransferase [Betaproteobacteria bacterium]
MKIVIVTPAAVHSRSGNRNTALRWGAMLRRLGYRVRVQVDWDGAPADLMLALHARKSHPSIRRFSARYPDRPLILALTGTDLYRDIRTDAGARQSMEIATRMIVLQDQGLKELAPELRKKTRVVYQSAPTGKRLASLKSCFEVVVVGHLREEKDPFRCAMALQHLPGRSQIRVVQLGRSMAPEMASEAKRWMEREPRYRWLGERPHGQALQRLARSRLMVISSRMEGGANVVCEALALGVPVIASRISGNLGMLGPDYPGYYPVENERALARLLWRAESDGAYYRSLARACAARRKLVTPDRELLSLRRVLEEVAPASRKLGRGSRSRP